MNRRNKALALALAAGGLAGAASLATAQPYVINISGATLLQNYIRNPLSTIDVIDVNGDGLFRPNLTQQLVQFVDPPSSLPGFPATGSSAVQWWIVQYRSVGSVNGIRNLVRYGRPVVVSENAEGPLLDWRRTETVAYQHRIFIDNSQANPIVIPSVFNFNNPGGLPVRAIVTPGGSFPYVPYNSTNGGIQIDIAPVDVPTSWGITYPGTDPQPRRKPFAPAYGENPRVGTNKQGVPPGNPGELDMWKLVDLFSEGRNLNINNPDSNTIFDNQLAFGPVALFVNQGVGRLDYTMADLRHLYATGRLPNGENLTAVTRSVGSGTHNAWMNSIGLDPSWGIGEGIGPESSPPNQHFLGDEYIPCNSQGSGQLETKLRNTRLGVGYTGGERAVNSNLVTQRRFDLGRVKADGGTDWVRPELSKLLNNGLRGEVDPDGGVYATDGWRIGGPAILASLGDPRKAPTNKGGDGSGGPAAMENIEAAAYLNNIEFAIAALASNPTCPLPPVAQRGPAEGLATSFILVRAMDRIQDLADPQDFRLRNAGDPSYLPALQNLYLTCSDFSQVYLNPVYDSNRAGFPEYQSPKRKASADGQSTPYTDGQINNYITLGGESINYNIRMDQAPVSNDAYQRNRIAGDFDGNGVRDINDTCEMIAAWRGRNGGPVWDGGDVENGTITAARGQGAITEMLGDFNGDGNFTADDVRYFADGLAMIGGQLNRKAGFTAVDSCFGGNFFGTTLATGTAYKFGDSRADIAGAVGTTPGFAPVGYDGVVDGKDIDYIFKQYVRNSETNGAPVVWATDLNAAARADLSADMNGDLIIDRNDVTEVLQNILCTRWWDVNLDGVVDAADIAIVIANLGQPGGWAQGDVDGDGMVTAADLALICAADFNGDGQVDFFDYLDFVQAYDAGC